MNGRCTSDTARTPCFRALREGFYVMPETQAVRGVYRLRKVTRDLHFAWYNGVLYHDDNVEDMEVVQKVICGVEVNGTEITHLTLPEGPRTDEMVTGDIGTRNVANTVPWGAVGWSQRLDVRALGEGEYDVKNSIAAPKAAPLPPASVASTAAPPRVIVNLNTDLLTAAQRVRGVWSIPVPFDRDPISNSSSRSGSMPLDG